MVKIELYFERGISVKDLPKLQAFVERLGGKAVAVATIKCSGCKHGTAAIACELNAEPDSNYCKKYFCENAK